MRIRHTLALWIPPAGACVVTTPADTDLETDADPMATVTEESAARLANVREYVTYYGRDPAQIEDLGRLDLGIVQPLLTSDQRQRLQTNADVAVYLSIGEIGLSNTYFVDGEEVLGQVIYDAHPEWFLGKNPFFDAWFADANQSGWQDFVLDQASQLLSEGYDGLFLDTVDTVDVYPEIIEGMVTLIERLRAQHPTAVLIQNRGMNIIEMSGPSVDALMFEVFSSTYDSAKEAYVRTDVTAPGYPEIVEKAVAYRESGGVVLAQDFALPGGPHDDLICYARDRALEHDFVPSYADKFFQEGRFDYPSTCPWPLAPRLKLALEPAVVHLDPGATVEVEVSMAVRPGSNAPIPLSVTGSAVGIEAMLRDDRLEPDGTATLVVSAATNAATGTLSLPLEAGGERFDVPLVVHDETIWVTNAGLSNVVAIDEPFDQAPPVSASRITGFIAQPYAVDVDAHSQRWVVENVGAPEAIQPAGRVQRFGRFDLTAPDLEVTAGLTYPTGLAIDATGAVWVTNSALDWTGTPRETPNIAKIEPSGSAAATAFTYDHLALGYPLSIAIDPSQRLWVTTTYGLALGFVPRDDGGRATPFAILAGSVANPAVFDTLRDLVFDDAGDLWVSAQLQGQPRVVEIPAGTWAEDGALSSLDANDGSTLLTEGLYSPWGLDFDEQGRLWVVNATDAQDDASSRGSLVAFDPPVSGASPARVVPLASRYTLGIAVARP